MKKLFIIPIVLASQALYAQNYQVSDYDQSVNPGQVIKEIKLPPAKTKGTVYLNDSWQPGSFKMKGAPLYKNLFVRYDLQHQSLEIKVQDEIKVCVLSILEEFYLTGMPGSRSKHFVNIKSIENAYVIGHKGMVEILLDDKASLYKQYYLVTQEANYSPTTDTGSKDNKVIIKSSYYLASNGELVKFYSNFKKNKEVLGGNFEELQNFKKEHKLNLKNESDIIKLIAYYNTYLSK